MAFTAASVASDIDDRSPAERVKPVDPMPTMATWSLIGLRGIDATYEPAG